MLSPRENDVPIFHVCLFRFPRFRQTPALKSRGSNSPSSCSCSRYLFFSFLFFCVILFFRICESLAYSGAPVGVNKPPRWIKPWDCPFLHHKSTRSISSLQSRPACQPDGEMHKSNCYKPPRGLTHCCGYRCCDVTQFDGGT